MLLITDPTRHRLAPAVQDRVVTCTIETLRRTPFAASLGVTGALRADTAELLCAVIGRHVALGRVRIRIDASQATTVEPAALERLASTARDMQRLGAVLTMSGVTRARVREARDAVA
jgi:anti-anti-sigma regulatory factor